MRRSVSEAARKSIMRNIERTLHVAFTGMAGLDSLYSRLKTAGIQTWSDGGFVRRQDGTRAVVVCDPDVGAFVELFEKPQE
jgi:hypothetical protein